MQSDVSLRRALSSDSTPVEEPTTAKTNTPRLIAMAVSLVGGNDARVRAQMQCSEADFRGFCAGMQEPDGAQFDRLIALIIHEQGVVIARNRELLDKLKRKK